nr:MAG TPA: hypothetical protein [Caudoviricetes sp.]
MRWNTLGPTDAAGRTGGTIAAMPPEWCVRTFWRRQQDVARQWTNASKLTMFSMRGRWCPGGGVGAAENQGGRSLERVAAFFAVRGARAIPNVELQTSFACVTLEGRRKYFAV